MKSIFRNLTSCISLTNFLLALVYYQTVLVFYLSMRSARFLFDGWRPAAAYPHRLRTLASIVMIPLHGAVCHPSAGSTLFGWQSPCPAFSTPCAVILRTRPDLAVALDTYSRGPSFQSHFLPLLPGPTQHFLPSQPDRPHSFDNL